MAQYIGSTTPLPAGNTYTSRWNLSDIFANITGAVTADQAGSLFIDQSGDGTTADITQTIAVTANTVATFNVTLLLPYYRVRMTNTAGSAQTTLRLFTRQVLGNMP